ncbi:MAG: hypothetical protein JWL77_3412 [Chthonomonadaceae bacterium]|nr:hypothetical protein [Chthonomonadaceae bacterium]
MKRVAGGFILLMGVILAAWMFYNIFIHRLPEAQGRPILPPLLVCIGFIYVGAKWLRGQTA